MDSLAFGTQVLVHLDLKGAPPRISYLEKFFPFLREIGITGILLEWEDTFPYTKDLMPLGGLSYGALASGSPYSIEDAKQILQIAADCGLTVIPLLQTFGHLEFVLKHEQWRCLREVEAYPSSMCPLKSGTMPLIRSLIKQIIAFHPDIQYIHIGADEVWHLGLCPECTRKAQSSKHGKASLFLDHVTSVAQYIKDNFPNLKIIMWDDMLRNIDVTALQEYFIGNLVEPMIWHYNNKQTFTLGYALWEKYSNIFGHIWGASAFKGASGSCQIVPVNKHYVENHEAWLSELGAYGSKIHSFRGIVLTGWSRYDHYATLCELLPTAVPSLALCLKTWQSGGYTQQIHDSVSKFLGYTEPPLYLQSPIRPYSIAHELSFPGWQILVGVEWFANIKAKYRNIVDSDQVQTWFNQWQILNNYTNPMQIESILPVLTELLLEVTTLENFLKTNLDMFFFPPTAEEFLGTWLIPIKQQVRQLKCDCETQISIGCRVRETKLDEEYRNCLKFLRAYIIDTSNPSYMSHCRVWIEKMNTSSMSQKDVRNKYMNELCRQIHNGKLEEPFTLPPPPFGDISTLTPHIAQTNSWSDMSTISTTTIEVAASGDSQADEPAKKSSDKFMNIYENKLNEQNDMIEDLKRKNYALSEQLNDCSVQINTQNNETQIGINMLASEVEYLKNRLKEIVTMKRNLQDEHNTIVIEWQNTTHSLQSKLDEEQNKNNELSATIQELENKLKVFEECDLTTSVGENIQQNLLDLHQAEISALEDKHSEILKNLEEKYVDMLSNKDKETEEKIRDVKISYEQKIAEIISDAERNDKLKNDEITKLEKVVEEQCERSQMEHDTSCNNETLVEKVSFMQQCILKMERLLRKYESNYTKKIYALNKELQMKENTVQIQLTTQRAQLLAQANSEKHLEIEAIISQLECRYRTLLEEQQVQFQKIRQEDLDTIKQLTNKLEEKI